MAARCKFYALIELVDVDRDFACGDLMKHFRNIQITDKYWFKDSTFQKTACVEIARKYNDAQAGRIFRDGFCCICVTLVEFQPYQWALRNGASRKHMAILG